MGKGARAACAIFFTAVQIFVFFHDFFKKVFAFCSFF